MILIILLTLCILALGFIRWSRDLRETDEQFAALSHYRFIA